MGWILRLQNFPAMLYIAVTSLKPVGITILSEFLTKILNTTTQL